MGEAGVIDNVLDGDDSEENSEDDDEEEDEAEAGEEAKENTEAEGAGPSVSGETEEVENVKDNESIGSNDAGTSDVKDCTDKKTIDQEEIDDPSNLQLAWEMLELA